MDYLDQQAEESEGGSTDASINDDDQPKLKKRKMKDKKEKKSKKKRVVESSDDDEDDEDDEAKAAEEMKGFIADEEEEEEPGDDEDDARSGKSKEDEDMDDLDEDDLDLIEENLDQQPTRKRIVETFDSDEELDDRTAIQKKLFGDGDDDEAPSARREPAELLSGSEDEGSEDNFIVNEDEGERPKKRRHHKRELNIPAEAINEARDIFGVEDFNLEEFYDENEEAEDEEEDEMADEEGEVAPTRRARQKDKKTSILDAMDPSELDRGFMSTYDKKIMLEDKPERFQLRKTPITEADDAELEIESRWIFRHAFNNWALSTQPSREPDVLKANSENQEDRATAEARVTTIIKEVLRCLRNQAFEVPFIFFYRKETYENMLTLGEMWRIYEYDEKWCHLQQRKNKVMELMKRMQTFLVESQSAKSVSEADIHEVHKVDDEESLADIYSQFQLHHGNDIAKMIQWEKSRRGEDDNSAAAKYKQGSRNDRYLFCYDNGIGHLANRFGLTARQFAENMDWKRHEVTQDPMTVEAAAAEYISSSLPEVADVISSAGFMVAKELSRQPMVREKVRRAFRRRATINVRPTKAGRAQLDDSHPIYTKRYLKEKPIKDLEGDEFLYYWQLKQAGLLNVTIQVQNKREVQMNETLADEVLLEAPYRKDDYTELVESWNSIRNMAVKQAVNEMLIPYLRDELEKKLLAEAKLAVAEKCASELARLVEMQGFKPLDYDPEEEEHEIARLGHVRVMAIAYPDDPMEASFGAVVNQDGQMVDYVRMVHFTKRGDREGEFQRLKKESMDFFKRMVERKRPHIIGLCAENMESIRLKKDLEFALQDMYREGQIPQDIQVVFLPCDVPKVYAGSKQALSDFPDYPPTLRQAVAAARVLIDPLIEVASLWNPDEDILCLPLHPLQKDVDKELIVRELQKQMINRISEVGVDINRCMDNPYHIPMIQFISGLGPRKAINLLKEIRSTTHVLSGRTNLVTHFKMGPKVFMNCAGFIKIEQTRVGDRQDEFAEVLDHSRIHPETYEWARKMAVDALEVDDATDPQSALEMLERQPERLKDLDLEAFADELDRQGFGEKRATLYDISHELHLRYKDRRRPFEPMRMDELYEYLAREMKDMLKPQKIVIGTVTGVQYRRLTDDQREQTYNAERNGSNEDEWMCQFCYEKKNTLQDIYDHITERDSRKGGCLGMPVGVRVRLENGFSGFIPNKLLSDNPKSFKHPSERAHVGRSILCRVQSVEIEKFSCLLSCRSSDLKEDEHKGENARWWDADAEQEDKENDALELRKKNDKGNLFKRVCQHQSFQNIGYQEAQRQLSRLDNGDCIIRPSSKSKNRLTATWKVVEGVFANVEIEEHDKELEFSIGRRLIIAGEEFEDLNEILARYIQPMVLNAKDIIMYKYFFDGVFSEETLEIEKRLRDERKKNPGRIPYALTASMKWPGKFLISFAHPKIRTVLHEYMTVTPEGIRFRTRVFGTFDQLINWFKIHFNEMPQPSYR